MSMMSAVAFGVAENHSGRPFDTVDGLGGGLEDGGNDRKVGASPTTREQRPPRGGTADWVGKAL